MLWWTRRICVHARATASRIGDLVPVLVRACPTKTLASRGSPPPRFRVLLMRVVFMRGNSSSTAVKRRLLRPSLLLRASIAVPSRRRRRCRRRCRHRRAAEAHARSDRWIRLRDGAPRALAATRRWIDAAAGRPRRVPVGGRRRRRLSLLVYRRQRGPVWRMPHTHFLCHLVATRLLFTFTVLQCCCCCRRPINVVARPHPTTTTTLVVNAAAVAAVTPSKFSGGLSMVFPRTCTSTAQCCTLALHLCTHTLSPPLWRRGSFPRRIVVTPHLPLFIRIRINRICVGIIDHLARRLLHASGRRISGRRWIMGIGVG